ncbi:hypothetical protein ACFL3S_02820 [Gemmatimonadota bacterium]
MEGLGAGWQLAYLDYREQFLSEQGPKVDNRLAVFQAMGELPFVFQSPKVLSEMLEAPENILEAKDILRGWDDSLRPPVAKWP